MTADDPIMSGPVTPHAEQEATLERALNSPEMGTLMLHYRPGNRKCDCEFDVSVEGNVRFGRRCLAANKRVMEVAAPSFLALGAARERERIVAILTKMDLIHGVIDAIEDE